MEKGCVERPAGTGSCIETYPTRIENDVVMISVPLVDAGGAASATPNGAGQAA